MHFMGISWQVCNKTHSISDERSGYMFQPYYYFIIKSGLEVCYRKIQH